MLRCNGPRNRNTEFSCSHKVFTHTRPVRLASPSSVQLMRLQMIGLRSHLEKILEVCSTQRSSDKHGQNSLDLINAGTFPLKSTKGGTCTSCPDVGSALCTQGLCKGSTSKASTKARWWQRYKRRQQRVPCPGYATTTQVTSQTLDQILRLKCYSQF